jgi:hypothetical protein
MARTRVKPIRAGGGPLLDPTSRWKILQQIHLLSRLVPDGAKAPAETSLMELKQLWLMSR